MKKITIAAFLFCLYVCLFAGGWKTIQFGEERNSKASVTHSINIDDSIKMKGSMNKKLYKEHDETVEGLLDKYTEIIGNQNVTIKTEMYDSKYADGRYYRVLSQCICDLSSGYKEYQITVTYFGEYLNSLFGISETNGSIQGKKLQWETAYSSEENRLIMDRFIKEYCEDF